MRLLEVVTGDAAGNDDFHSVSSMLNLQGRMGLCRRFASPANIAEKPWSAPSFPDLRWHRPERRQRLSHHDGTDRRRRCQRGCIKQCRSAPLRCLHSFVREPPLPGAGPILGKSGSTETVSDFRLRGSENAFATPLSGAVHAATAEDVCRKEPRCNSYQTLYLELTFSLAYC